MNCRIGNAPDVPTRLFLFVNSISTCLSSRFVGCPIGASEITGKNSSICSSPNVFSQLVENVSTHAHNWSKFRSYIPISCEQLLVPRSLSDWFAFSCYRALLNTHMRRHLCRSPAQTHIFRRIFRFLHRSLRLHRPTNPHLSNLHF